MSEKHSSLIFLRRKTSRMIYSRPTSFLKVHGMNNVLGWMCINIYQTVLSALFKVYYKGMHKSKVK